MATLGMLLHKYLPNVRELALPGNPAVDDAGMQALCEGLGRGDAPSLRNLDLSDTSFGPAGAEALAAALSRGAMLNLETVYWPSVKNLGDQGVAALAAPLRKLPALKELCLTRCNIGDEGVATLLGRGAMPKLEILSLSNNPIGNQGVAALGAPLRKLPGLKVLTLINCGIGDEGVASLVADLGKDDFKALKELWLNHNKITDVGMVKLVAAIAAGGLPKMRGLPWLDNNPASDAACKAVSNAVAKRSQSYSQ